MHVFVCVCVCVQCVERAGVRGDRPPRAVKSRYAQQRRLRDERLADAPAGDRVSSAVEGPGKAAPHVGYCSLACCLQAWQRMLHRL